MTTWRYNMAKNTKKDEKSTETETRDKKPARTNLDLLKSKVNSAGGIILRQVGKLEKAQRNAIKSEKVTEFNLTMQHLSEKILALKIPENATADPEAEIAGFDMDSIAESLEEETPES